MIFTLYLIGAWITITPPSALVTDSTDLFLLEFNRQLQPETIFNESNYSIKEDDLYEIEILDIKVITYLDNISIPANTLIALTVRKVKDRKLYYVTVNNLRDILGNLIDQGRNSDSYFNNNYAPNLESEPRITIK